MLMLLYFATLELAFTMLVAVYCAFVFAAIGIYVSIDERRLAHVPVTRFVPESSPRN